MCAGVASHKSPTVSPQDRNKLSINFLSDDRPRAESGTHSRSHSSALSTRARGVNRQEASVSAVEDVEVATESPGRPSRCRGDSARPSRARGSPTAVPRSYRLEIVQHPDRTAEFGASTLTRLPLAPPLIAQLVVRDADGRSVVE